MGCEVGAKAEWFGEKSQEKGANLRPSLMVSVLFQGVDGGLQRYSGEIEGTTDRKTSWWSG